MNAEEFVKNFESELKDQKSITVSVDFYVKLMHEVLKASEARMALKFQKHNNELLDKLTEILGDGSI